MKGRYSKVEKHSFYDIPSTSCQDIPSNTNIHNTNIPRYPKSKYSKINYLCDGSVSTIYEGIAKNSDKVVIKKISKSESWISELNTLMKLRNVSKRIINIIDSYDTFRYVYIVTKLYDGSDLYDNIYDNIPLSFKRGIIIANEIGNAIKDCHDNNVLHLDIKFENYICTNKNLFDSDDNLIADIVLTDFGHSEIVEDINKIHYGVRYGTSYFTCPEGYYYEIFSSKSDVWSFGICFSILMTGDFPFNGRKRDYYKNAIGLSYSDNVLKSSDFIKNILNLCLCPNPLKRPSMSKILELINTV